MFPSLSQLRPLRQHPLRQRLQRVAAAACPAVLALLLCVVPLAPASARDNPQAPPQVTLQTSRGDIVLELDPDKAPETVANFLRYVRDGYYDGTIFHRVIDGFMAQGGGFTADFQRKSTRTPIRNEADNGLANRRGTVAMARTSDPHSATAQFFINVADNAFLNHSAPTARGWGYTVFGRVVEGMDVVDDLVRAPTGPGGPFPKDVPQQAVVIERAVVDGSE